MKIHRLEISRICRMTLIIVLLAGAGTRSIYAQYNRVQDTVMDDNRNYLATSVFVLSSLIPNDDTYFFELDYGRKLHKDLDVILGLNIYKYAAPMSTPLKSDTKYPGPVLSYGVVTACQYYFWKSLFIDIIINPLVLDYSNYTENQFKKGFMLLMATRLAYHHDFRIFDRPFFIELGAEFNCWPVNINVPEDYRTIDDLYRNTVFSPAFQFGYKF